MSFTSQQRRLERRAAARRLPTLVEHDPRPNTECPRCHLRLGRGQLGVEVTYWHGVAKRRREVTARVCAACALEVKRAGAGGGIGMHGAAHAGRTRHEQKWLYTQLGESELLAAYAAWKCSGGRKGRTELPAIAPYLNGIAPVALPTTRTLTCPACGAQHEQEIAAE